MKKYRTYFLDSTSVDLYIYRSAFEGNSGYEQLIYVNGDDHNVNIESTIFNNNSNINYDYNIDNTADSINLHISNSKFLNGNGYFNQFVWIEHLQSLFKTLFGRGTPYHRVQSQKIIRLDRI